MTTMVRSQMAASTGALAAERQRLEEEIARLSTGLPEGAAEVVRRADEIMAAHGARLAELKARRDEIDARFDVSERERREAEAAAREAEIAAARQALAGEAEAYIEAIGECERAARALAAGVQKVLELNASLSVMARELSDDAKAPNALNPLELERRMALRIASIMTTIPKRQFRLGDLEWPSAARGWYPPEQSWVEAEQQRITAHVIEPLTKGH